MALIIPQYSLEKELSTMIARHFYTVRAFAAPEQRFKQLVVMGVKQKADQLDMELSHWLQTVGKSDQVLDEFPEA
jgi:hypothetical protein